MATSNPVSQRDRQLRLPEAPAGPDMPRFRGRRLALLGIGSALVASWTVYLNELGFNAIAPVLLGLPALAWIVFTPSSIILQITSGLELKFVRLVGDWCHSWWLVVVYAAQAALLGLFFRPFDLGLSRGALVFVIGFGSFGAVLRFAGQAFFAANVRGPRQFGAVALSLTAIAPMALAVFGMLWHAARPVSGALLLAYSLQCLICYLRQSLVGTARRFQAPSAFTEDATAPGTGRIIRRIRQTEQHLKNDFVERGLLGYYSCWALFLTGGFLNAAYRHEFRRLRIKRAYSCGEHRRVVTLTSLERGGAPFFLRIESLIHLRRLEEASALVEQALQTDSDNPYFHLAKAHICLESEGSRSREYRAELRQAAGLASERLRIDSHSDICPAAIAENAVREAVDTALAPRRAGLGARDTRRMFASQLRDIDEARLSAEGQCARLASEIRGLEGIVQSLAGDYREGYRCFLEALAGGENLIVRYYLAVLLMIGSATFLRPIYHLQRIIACTERTSRLNALARARLDEALRAHDLNLRLSASSSAFHLVTFSRHHLETAEVGDRQRVPFVLRDDGEKRKIYERHFRRQPNFELTPMEIFVSGGLGMPATSSAEEVENEELKKQVRMPAV